MQVRCGVVMFEVECVLQRIYSLYSDCGSWSFLFDDYVLIGLCQFRSNRFVLSFCRDMFP